MRFFTLFFVCLFYTVSAAVMRAETVQVFKDDVATRADDVATNVDEAATGVNTAKKIPTPEGFKADITEMSTSEVQMLKRDHPEYYRQEWKTLSLEERQKLKAPEFVPERIPTPLGVKKDFTKMSPSEMLALKRNHPDYFKQEWRYLSIEDKLKFQSALQPPKTDLADMSTAEIQALKRDFPEHFQKEMEKLPYDERQAFYKLHINPPPTKPITDLSTAEFHKFLRDYPEEFWKQMDKYIPEDQHGKFFALHKLEDRPSLPKFQGPIEKMDTSTLMELEKQHNKYFSQQVAMLNSIDQTEVLNRLRKYKMQIFGFKKMPKYLA
jgi:hypothetical protein